MFGMKKFYDMMKHDSKPRDSTSTSQAKATAPSRDHEEDEKEIDRKETLLDPNRLVGALRRQLKQRQFYGLPDTDGSYLALTKARLREEHIILSTCYCHKLHPFSGWKRLLWLWNHISSLFMWSAILGLSFPGNDAATIFTRSLATVCVCMLSDTGVRSLLDSTCLISRRRDEPSSDMVGKSVMAAFTISGFSFSVVGVLLAGYQGASFVASWLVAQIFAAFADAGRHALVQYCFMGWQKRLFESKYQHFFPDESPPLNLSEVAVMSREVYGMHHLPEGMSETEWLDVFKVTSDTRRVKVPPSKHLTSDTYVANMEPLQTYADMKTGNPISLLGSVFRISHSGLHGFRFFKAKGIPIGSVLKNSFFGSSNAPYGEPDSQRRVDRKGRSPKRAHSGIGSISNIDGEFPSMADEKQTPFYEKESNNNMKPMEQSYTAAVVIENKGTDGMVNAQDLVLDSDFKTHHDV
mmetsp:Transcript_25964/g.36187  ORF Transcript_25964/g.36187 Transcript_25964/m.36187 type:complete len:465 (+) Transcript_25964:66-1460(+)